MSAAGRMMLLALGAQLGGLALPAPSATAAAGTANLASCAAVAAADARLACYDTLAGRITDGNLSVPKQAAVAAVPGTALPAAPATPAPQTAIEATRNFGLSAAQLHTAPQGPQAIEARISQVIADQYRRSYVILDNGQTWTSTEGEMTLDSGESVTISRAALGSFLLTAARSKHSYHVRRVR